MSFNLQEFFTKYVLTLIPIRCKECYTPIEEKNIFENLCIQCYYNQPENPIYKHLF